MKRKVKEFLTEMLMGVLLALLLCTFVLSFIFVDQYFFTCVWIGILATIVFASICWGKELVCE